MAPRSAFDLDSLSSAIPAIFDQAQTSAATHKKNSVALYKLQSASAAVVERGRSDAEVRLVGERTFAEVSLDMLNRVLVVKKSTPTADRIVRFVTTYVKFLNEKATESDEEETPTTRFIARLLKYFLKGFQAKSKDVRFRCLNFVSDIVSSLGELDQDLYAELKAALMERLSDKEPLVRAHSVTALSVLAASEDPYDLEDDEPPIITSLLSSLYHDPAAEVRRAALLHLPFTPTSLPALLSRTRDPDALTRKLVFASVLPRLAHPRQLTLAQRETIVQRGLGDRAEAVRVAAAKLLGSWVDACEEEGGAGGGLEAFVKLFDVGTPEVARDALKSIFVTRKEVVSEIEFDEAFWADLKPESAMLASTFVEHCIDTADETRLEATLPVVTALAFLLQSSYNAFLALLADADNDNEEEEDEDMREERIANSEFIMNELLRLAVHLDYTDEIGRRKMFGVVRNMLAHPELPEPLIEPCVGILHIMSPNERDLIRVIVEVISELRDPGSDADESMALDDENDAESVVASAKPGRGQRTKTAQEMTPEEKIEADITDLRCLCLCIAVLGRIHGSFEENSTLTGILDELIVPSVKRKELVLREKGLVSLGLCCLIAKNMALSSFQLFLSQVQSSPESLRTKVLQVVFDIMITYEKDLFGGADPIGERVIAFLMKALETEESKSVQALMCLGLAKLMLFGLVTDTRVLMSLVFAYVSPTNADNQELRQCLAYFLPVYCYSSAVNQSRMQSIFVEMLDLIFSAYEDLEDDQDMITPLQFGQLLLDWTDGSKVVGADEQNMSSVHVNLAVDIVKALYNNERPVEERKTLCHFLGKLNFPSSAEQSLLNTLYILVVNLTELCPFEDSTTDKAYQRFKVRFEKHFAMVLVDYDEQVCFNDADGAYNEVFEFIGVTRPRPRRFEGQAPGAVALRGTRAPYGNEVSEVDNDTEAETETIEKPSKAGNKRQAAKTNRRGATATSRAHSSSDSSASEDEDEGQVTESEKRPKKVAHSRSRKQSDKNAAVREPSTPSNSEPDVEDASGAESSSEVDGEGEEDKRIENRPESGTPPRRNNAKRLHTPTKSPSIPSPAPKRQNRGTNAASKNGKRAAPRASSSTIIEPPSKAANKKGKPKPTGRAAAAAAVISKPAARGRGRPPPKLRSPRIQASDNDDDIGVSQEEPSSTEASDNSIPPTRQRAALNKVARPAPRIIEEKIGWSDSSDF